MKLVTAVIQPHARQDVIESLREYGVTGATAADGLTVKVTAADLGAVTGAYVAPRAGNITFREYAEAAGFAAVEELPVEHDQFRFYRLTA